MPRLVINPRSPSPWEVQLKPGMNLLGRGFANDFKIDDPTVSSSHCQIVVANYTAVIKDLGSTNGTFINRAPVTEAVLLSGQTIHLGGVEMVFQSDAPASAKVAETEVLPRPAGTPTGVLLSTAAAASPPAPAMQAAAPPPVPAARAVAAPPPLAPPPIPTAVPAAGTVPGPRNCKFHPKTPGRFFCYQCRQFFCELCVASRPVSGVQRKFCRHCAVECAPVDVPKPKLATPESFYRRLPATFLYPARGSGILALIVFAFLLFGLEFIARFFMRVFFVYFLLGIMIEMIAYGYLFSFMQSIIHSTTAGDEEMPGLPPFEGLFGAFGRLAGAGVMSFGPAFALFVVAFFNESSSAASTLMIAALAFGCIYFPMALLAVAMKDTPLAANPLIVVPAIAKAPLEYLVTVVLLAAVMALRGSGDTIIHAIFPRGLTTHVPAKMVAFLATSAFWNLAQVYLLAVNMRILGLFYLAKKRELAWFEH